MKVKTKQDYCPELDGPEQREDWLRSRGTKDYGPSVTVPDQSIDLKDMVARFGREAVMNATPVKGEPFFNGDEILPDLATMDPADREQLVLQNQFEIDRLKKQRRKELAAERRAVRYAEKKEAERIKGQPEDASTNIP